jgi:hypothetical protein
MAAVAVLPLVSRAWSIQETHQQAYTAVLCTSSSKGGLQRGMHAMGAVWENVNIPGSCLQQRPWQEHQAACGCMNSSSCYMWRDQQPVAPGARPTQEPPTLQMLVMQ